VGTDEVGSIAITFGGRRPVERANPVFDFGPWYPERRIWVYILRRREYRVRFEFLQDIDIQLWLATR
jgi:hypothetical protein